MAMAMSSGAAPRPSDAGKDERYRTTGQDEDAHPRAALGSADAAVE
jgi:hypothetical protein